MTVTTGTTSKGAQSPAMQQYLREKASYPDALLFFRMGDFYELFFDDALVAARCLDLTLTSRNKNEADSIPMCGVPHHAAQGYIARLLEQGYNVAVCEQLEDPSKAKGIVKRGVVRVLTPALVLDAETVDARTNLFLAAALPPDGGADMPGSWSIAAYDLTTGELFAAELSDVMGVIGELARLDVRELVVPRDAEEAVRAQTKILARTFVRGAAALDARAVTAELADASEDPELRASLEALSPPARAAAALALRYARASQPGQAVPLQRVARLEPRDHLLVDETTQAHLELFRTLRGEKKGSLLAHLDRSVTPMGARRLRSWIAFPLQDVRRIRRRHDAVDALVTYPLVRESLRAALKQVPDIERIAVRAQLGAANPRDLAALREGLARVPEALSALRAQPDAAEAFRSLRDLDPCADLLAVLQGSLADAPPVSVEDGGVFRAGFDPDLDRYVDLATNGRNVILALEARERERTRIASLKVRFNNVFGYFIEVTKANLHLVPKDYRRKQTVATGERFVTDELTEIETGILEAEEKLKEIERARFEELRARVAANLGRLSKLANTLADADALSAFAEVAHRHDYTRPVVDDGLVIELIDARHPVVETMLEPGAYVPNDVSLDQQGTRLLLVTGPNMAGKSTVMRMAALHTLMAQAGCFVPASSAQVGRVDRIYTRVGASDDVARGASTFMVEMRETAQILRGATTRSLVLFDEIGRGTSTFDGLAIAWSVAEHLHDAVRARAMFATHYHELCALSDTRPHAANVNVSARESGDDIVFLHKLAPGGASKSYGVAVARLAGVPEPVLARARALLKDLERGEGPFRRAPRQMGLFEERPAPLATPATHPCLAALEAVDIDRMTPLDALHFVSQLRALLSAGR
ncbi:MAG: DNA mismatch repair protein MutS [Polyangiales bacterium]